jgi:hypothetical protein
MRQIYNAAVLPLDVPLRPLRWNLLHPRTLGMITVSLLLVSAPLRTGMVADESSRPVVFITATLPTLSPPLRLLPFLVALVDRALVVDHTPMLAHQIVGVGDQLIPERVIYARPWLPPQG